ncbi:MAG: hypothetical protein P8079_05115 [Gammaproteobacteria bacterium]|jgi:hypothetical protein
MKLRTTLTVIALTAATLLTVSLPATAERRERGWHGHHDIRHFDRHDLHRWRGGHWVHGRHDGFLGWWWVVAGIWYFYPAPIHPYPNPYVPPAAVPPPSPPPSAARYWYYCEAAQTYYPYIATCPGGWKKVPVIPPDAPQQ